MVFFLALSLSLSQAHIKPHIRNIVIPTSTLLWAFIWHLHKDVSDKHWFNLNMDHRTLISLNQNAQVYCRKWILTEVLTKVPYIPKPHCASTWINKPVQIQIHRKCHSMNVARTILILFHFLTAVFGYSLVPSFGSWPFSALHLHSTGIAGPENIFYFHMLDLNHSNS